jgi:hypothetical protein
VKAFFFATGLTGFLISNIIFIASIKNKEAPAVGQKVGQKEGLAKSKFGVIPNACTILDALF